MTDDLLRRRRPVAPITATAPWSERLDRVLAQIAPGIVEREREGSAPADVFAALRGERLLGLTVPAELGGEGATLAEAADAARRVARVDGGIAHALGYHWTWLWFVAAYGVHGVDGQGEGLASARELARRTAAEGLVWASIGSAFGGSGGTERLPGEVAWAVSAVRGFATGAPLADLLFTQSVVAEDGRMRIWAVPTDRPGVAVRDGWDPVGQRLSASPGVVLEGVRVDERDLIAVVNPPAEHPLPLQSLMIPAFQALFAWLSVGVAEGALLEARAYVREQGRPWVHAAVERAVDDVHVASGPRPARRRGLRRPGARPRGGGGAGGAGRGARGGRSAVARRGRGGHRGGEDPRPSRGAGRGGGGLRRDGRAVGVGGGGARPALAQPPHADPARSRRLQARGAGPSLPDRRAPRSERLPVRPRDMPAPARLLAALRAADPHTGGRHGAASRGTAA
jgi:alkylation response protein AidB-like acyl-CoA dehydrogenase